MDFLIRFMGIVVYRAIDGVFYEEVSVVYILFCFFAAVSCVYNI